MILVYLLLLLPWVVGVGALYAWAKALVSNLKFIRQYMALDKQRREAEAVAQSVRSV